MKTRMNRTQLTPSRRATLAIVTVLISSFFSSTAQASTSRPTGDDVTIDPTLESARADIVRNAHLEVYAGRKFLAEPRPACPRPTLTPELAEIFGVSLV